MTHTQLTIDMPTTLGMRLAACEAVAQWHALPPTERTYSNAYQLLQQRVAANRFLQGAGTSKIVAYYYRDLFAQHETKVLDFLRAVKPADVAAVQQATTAGDTKALLHASGAFTHAFRKHIENTSLTESYMDFLYRRQWEVRGLAVEPRGFSAEDIAAIALYDRRFRDADRMDAALGSIPLVGTVLRHMFGIGYPTVSPYIQPFNAHQPVAQVEADAPAYNPLVPQTRIQADTALSTPLLGNFTRELRRA